MRLTSSKQLYLGQGREPSAPPMSCSGGPEHDVGGASGPLSYLGYLCLQEAGRLHNHSSRCPKHGVDGAPSSLPYLKYICLEEVSHCYNDYSRRPEQDVDCASVSLTFLRYNHCLGHDVDDAPGSLAFLR